MIKLTIAIKDVIRKLFETNIINIIFTPLSLSRFQLNWFLRSFYFRRLNEIRYNNSRLILSAGYVSSLRKRTKGTSVKEYPEIWIDASNNRLVAIFPPLLQNFSSLLSRSACSGPLHWSTSSHQLVCFWLYRRPRPFVEASFESSKPVGSRWRLRFLDRDPPSISSVRLSSPRGFSFLPCNFFACDISYIMQGFRA